MKLAFLISAHTDPKQLHRLINVLPKSASFFIHIDLKSNIDLFTKEIQDDRVHFIGKRLNVVWGTLIETEYQMELIRACLESGEHFDYLITISGLDYPVWGNEQIENYFYGLKGFNLLQGMLIEDGKKSSRLYQEYRFLNQYPQKSFLCRLGIVIREIIKFAGFKKSLSFLAKGKKYYLYKGAAWWAITSPVASFVLNEWDSNKDLVNYFKNSFGPAETFVQTVVFNSSFSSQCILTKGPYRGLSSLTPFTYIDYTTKIKVLTEEDYDKVINSGKMFCRKVTSEHSIHFMKLINQYRKTLHPTETIT